MNIQKGVNQALGGIEQASYHKKVVDRMTRNQNNLMAQRHQGYDSKKGEIANKEADKQKTAKSEQKKKLDGRFGILKEAQSKRETNEKMKKMMEESKQ